MHDGHPACRGRSDLKPEKSTQDKVVQFHEAFQAPIGGLPEGLMYSRRRLRVRLIEEEFDELIRSESFEDDVDALADLVYVCYGMAIEMGVDLDDIIDEVHAANMRKLDDKGNPILRDDGKILKPNGWEGPDIAGRLKRQEKGRG